MKGKSRAYPRLLAVVTAAAAMAIFFLLSAERASRIASASPGVQPHAATASAYYVAPTGSPAGDGSLAHPWDLQTALSHPNPVQPGDTIWLRGGTYAGLFTSDLRGAEGAPIIVRSLPGEWATIDTRATGADPVSFIVRSHWTYYWDIEIMNSRPADRGGGIQFAGGRHNKFINTVIHDLGGNSFGEPNEIYGSILYNNGADGSGLQHQLYVQNADPAQPSLVVDSILFNGYAFGIHAYSGGAGRLDGIHLVGNVWFNSGAAQTEGWRKDNVLVGGVNGSSNILLQENMGWAFSPSERSVALGRYSDLNQDITLIDNYLAGDTKFYNTWQSVTMTGNTFYAMSPGSGTNFDPTQFSHNLYLTARPTGAKIFIRPNQYEQGRAHIVIYNWDLADTVDVDLGALLQSGDRYEIRNAQNYFAPPVVSGTFDGSQVTLPMTGLSAAQPLGPGLIAPAEQTGPAFNVFVLRKTGTAPPTPTSTQMPLPTHTAIPATSTPTVTTTPWSSNSFFLSPVMAPESNGEKLN